MTEIFQLMLKTSRLTTGYGKKTVIDDIDIEVRKGEIVAILGHNGSGKSTLLKTIFGIHPPWAGTIDFPNVCIDKTEPASLIRCGITYVPQKNGIFSELTVEDNLTMAGRHLGNRRLTERKADIYGLFPQLKRRVNHLGMYLSGGERQSLALAMGLMPEPKMLLLDEPSLGLAPALVEEVFSFLKALNKNHGVTVVLVEQRVRLALQISNRAYILGNGKIKFSGTTSLLGSDEALRQAYL